MGTQGPETANGEVLSRPAPYPAGRPRLSFTRGHDKPRGVKWFGVQSFWGHLRHLAAVAIATEDVDSRAWMTPDPPDELLRRVCAQLGADETSRSVTEGLGRDLWIDFVADTGDDAAVSRAVARLVFTRYQLPDLANDGQELVAPRGDILFFGGDTAYPVATAEEITNRVLVPFNQVLSQRRDATRRVLLGIPGNHDWYDGLDGFQRVFRRRETRDLRGHAPTSRQSTTLITRYAQYAREFVRGGQIDKPQVLELLGYEPVQNASHFVLPLAPGLSLLAVDRQLRRVDPRQQEYFGEYLNTHLATTPWVVLPDPLYAFGEKNPNGMGMLEALGLRLHRRAQFFLAGDTHHYRRDQIGGSLHVTAGGGGAFLHPAAMVDGELTPLAEWPTRSQSRALLWQVPWKVAAGRSGIIPHGVLAFTLLPAFLGQLDLSLMSASGMASVVAATVALAIGLALLSGSARSKRGTLVLASLTAIAIASWSVALTQAVVLLQEQVVGAWDWALRAALLAVAVFGSVFLFGAYLALLTRSGLEHTQAFTALDHPGFKHFLRLRVRRDGSAIDGYCIGLVDPLAPGSEPVLVDHFSFRVDGKEPPR